VCRLSLVKSKQPRGLLIPRRKLKAGLRAKEHGEAAIDSMRRGDFEAAMSEGKTAIADVKTVKSGVSTLGQSAKNKDLRKQIERMKKTK
jgi:hypothetical protein